MTERAIAASAKSDTNGSTTIAAPIARTRIGAIQLRRIDADGDGRAGVARRRIEPDVEIGAHRRRIAPQLGEDAVGLVDVARREAPGLDASPRARKIARAAWKRWRRRSAAAGRTRLGAQHESQVRKPARSR